MDRWNTVTLDISKCVYRNRVRACKTDLERSQAGAADDDIVDRCDHAAGHGDEPRWGMCTATEESRCCCMQMMLLNWRRRAEYRQRQALRCVPQS